jgi:hypothetical protein
VAYGTADTTSPLYGSKGVVGHRLGWTKSVFVAGVRPPYQDLSIPAYKNLTDKLYHDGVEIIGHTITPTSDDRNAVGNGLKTLSQYGARNWIDHGINFEDIAHRGSLVNDPYYIVDLLINAGYRYVWTYLDYTYSIDMIDAPHTGFIDSYFYYNRNVDTGNQKLYLWSSIEVQNKPDLWYKTENIDNLINQRGIHIGHAYYAHALEENHAWWKNPATGKEEIYPDFEAALEYMAKKRTQGLLWTPTMSEAGDYWTSLANVLVERISDTQFRITNNNPASINGLTLLAEKDLKSALVEGTQITTFGAPYGPRELVIPTVASNKTVTVTIGY